MKKLLGASMALSLMLVGCSSSEQTESQAKEEEEDTEEAEEVVKEEAPVVVDSVVKLTPEQQEEQTIQTELEVAFESDMEIINMQINNILIIYNPFSQAVAKGEVKLNATTISPTTEAIGELLTSLESIQDYSISNRYGEIYNELNKGRMTLTQSKLSFESFVVFDNADFFITGHEKLVEGLDILTLAVASYTEEFLTK